MSNSPKRYWGILTYRGGREVNQYRDFRTQIEGIFKRSHALRLQIFLRKKGGGWEAVSDVTKEQLMPLPGEVLPGFDKLKWTEQ